MNSSITEAPLSSIIRGSIPTTASPSPSPSIPPAAPPITPAPAMPQSMTVNPLSLSLQPGQTGQLTAVAKDSSGNPLSVPITWSSAATSVATVNASGLVTAVAAGSATITASSTGISASTAVTVTTPTLGSFWLSNDFESGSPSPFFYPWTGAPNDFQVVSDPTASGHGQVAEFHYHRSSMTAESDDCDRALTWRPSTPVGYGQTFYFRGDFYIPQPTAVMANQNRKLTYLLKNSNSPYTDNEIVGAWGNAFYFSAHTVNYRVDAPGIATVNFDQWYHLEIQTTINSGPSTTDGVARVWLNGALIFQNVNMSFMQHTGPYENFTEMGFGYQVNASMLYDEYRYWDNVSFSSY